MKTVPDEKKLVAEVAKVRAAAQDAGPVSETIPLDDSGHLSQNTMSSVFASLEKLDHVVTHVVTNSVTYLDLRRFERDESIRLVTETWQLKAGLFMYLWTASVILDRTVPDGEMVFLYRKPKTKRGFATRYKISEAVSGPVAQMDSATVS